MSHFPSVKAKEFIKVIEQLGFYLDRQKGSQKNISHPDYYFSLVQIHRRSQMMWEHPNAGINYFIRHPLKGAATQTNPTCVG